MAQSIEFQPAPRDGVFLSSDDGGDYVTTPYDRSQAHVLYDRDGIVIENRTVEISNGSRYSITSSRLDNHVPDGLQGISYLETTAWTTQPKGMYTHKLICMGKLGVEGTVVSAPQNIGKIHSIAQNAHNVLQIGIHETDTHDRDSGLMIFAGDSRGAMVGNAMIESSEDYDITNIFSHMRAPCIPQKMDIKQVSTILSGLAGEAISFAALSRLSKSRLKHYGSTVDMNMKAPIIHAQEAISLLTGDAGEHAAHMSPETFAWVHMSLRDGLCNALIWNLKFSPFEGITTNTEINGGHLVLAGNKFHDRFLKNMTNVTEVLTDNPHLRNNPRDIRHNLSKLVNERDPEIRIAPKRIDYPTHGLSIVS